MEEVEKDFDYIASKLRISVDELKSYHSMPLKTYKDYKNQEFLFTFGSRLTRLLALIKTQKNYNMLRSRYIPVLLIEDGELTKTKQFQDGIYVGDPINAIRIFNEKEVDELGLFDISITKNNIK